ncbi:NAD(P)-binding protein [Lophium mytilinum]|uniref:NAD(P)-binding protein n=1 Tax=Lophium mytilinum TaxID=390894 RepID=A0A6A6QGX2_9PEZI|nr:NAD(P)-binding protein [Lophium mytilinum]
MVQNKGLIFKNVPNGWPKPGHDLVVEARDFDLDQSLPEGGVVVKNHYLSFDPYQRGRMRAPDTPSYSPPFKLGEPITNRGISTVVSSSTPDFKKGDVVVGNAIIGTEEYSVLTAEHTKLVKKLDNPLGLDPKIFLGALGMPGLTAWSSFYAIGEPKKGESILVSAASGAVGQIVGQLAKHEGLKVYGSVGDDAKLKYILEELGFDGGFNYKKETPGDALARLAPDGIDIYYENVGGVQLEAALNAMKPFGRIIACGMISQYNLPPKEWYGIKNTMMIVAKRVKFQGFIVGDDNMGPKYTKEHQEKLQQWIKDGSFKVKFSETVGIDNAVDGFIGMLEGKNFGKSVMVISEID